MNKLKSKKEQQKNGFTLAELLVSITVFSLIIGAVSGAFISTIQAQRKALSFQEILNQTSYLEEYMSRAIRMARKDFGGSCVAANSNYETTHSDHGLSFMNYLGNCQEFYVSDARLWENKDGIVSELTSTSVSVEEFNVKVLGNSQLDNLQPRATLFLKIKGTGPGVEQQAEIQIQTTLSQRKLDIQYQY